MRFFTVLMFAAGMFFTVNSIQADDDSAVKGKTATKDKSTVNNLALNKKYVSSDKNPWGWDGGLTDGSWSESNKTCFATKNTNNFPKHVTIDLAESIKISKVKLGVPHFGSTKTVNIEVSTDGKSFTKVGSAVFEQKKAEKKVVTFPAVEAKYLRLTFPDYHKGKVKFNPRFIFITEVEAYKK